MASYDFAGMNQDQQEQFKSAITDYIASIDRVLQGFKTHSANVQEALKGEQANPALKEYLNIAETVLTEYVNHMNEEFSFLTTASSEYTAKQAALGSKIQGQAEDLRSDAASFQLDK